MLLSISHDTHATGRGSGTSEQKKNMFRAALLLFVLLTPHALFPALKPQAVDIIRKAFEADQENAEIARNYTFHERIENRFFGKKGKLLDANSKTWDITLLDGSEYRRLILKNDKPLSEKQEAKEQRKLEKSIQKMRAETAKQRRKRRAKLQKEREHERRFRQEITRAFHFKLVAEETVGGVETYVISFHPAAGYQPAFHKAGVLKKVRGKLWIAKKDYAWVKADIKTIDGFRWGLFLVKIYKGARIQFSQQRINDEVWLLKDWKVRLKGRAALVAKFNGEFTGTYSHFRRFSTDSSIQFGETVR